MKSWILALSVAVASVGWLPMEADAKRMGGGGSSGMQRSLPSRPAPDAAPARPATPPAATAPTTPPKRSWMGPIAGLAAGLGIAALMSHLGLGAGMGNFLTLALLAVAAFFLIRFLMRRFGSSANGRTTAGAPGGMQFAGAGAPLGNPALAPTGGSGQRLEAVTQRADIGVARPTGLPPGFDVPAFERIAKMIFIRLQAANDSGDLDDLRAFTTPEMFAVVKLELQERGGAAQHTDVVQIDAEVLDFATEAERQVVSVRFHGLIREEKDAPTTIFDEVWHLLKPVDGSREWAIAGIQQAA